jgi:hypothetical protein
LSRFDRDAKNVAMGARVLGEEKLILPPRDEDKIPARMCLNCGVISPAGKHETLEDCIDALRDRIAELE